MFDTENSPNRPNDLIMCGVKSFPHIPPKNGPGVRKTKMT